MNITSAKFVRGITGSDDILHDGIPQIAFVGRSNVGKSSVINSLANVKDLVKVGKKPGKTTEINFFLINNKVYFVDLPGYGYAELNPVEKEKIRKRMLWYLMESEPKPVRVALILDIKSGFTEFDKEMAHMLRDQGHHFMIIANKADKLNQKEVSHQLTSIRDDSYGEDVVPYSATTGQGADAVLKLLLDFSQ